jgi:hypothetical protein
MKAVRAVTYIPHWATRACQSPAKEALDQHGNKYALNNDLDNGFGVGHPGKGCSSHACIAAYLYP